MAGHRVLPEGRRPALASNRERLAELYREHGPYTVHYIARRVEPQHSHVVEDLAQETFLRAWPVLHKVEVRDDSSYRRWLTAVARSRVANYYRTDRPDAAGRHGAETPVSPHAALWWSPRLVDDCAAAATGAVETRVDLQAALARLPAETRRALQLRYLEGMSRDAVAQQMHRGTKTVGALLNGGLAALGEMLGDGARVGTPVEPAGARALTVARELAARHGQLPAVREVARRAGVAQGTAATALASLRNQPAAGPPDPLDRARQAVAEVHQRVAEQAADARAQQSARWHADDEHREHAAERDAPAPDTDGAA